MSTCMQARARREGTVIGKGLAHPVEAAKVRLDEGGELVARDVEFRQLGARDEHARHPGHILPADVVLRDVDVLHLQIRVRDEPESGPSILGQRGSSIGHSGIEVRQKGTRA